MATKVEGPLKVLLLSLTALALIIVVGTFVGPFATEYEVKTAARMACNEYRNAVRANSDTRSWETSFVAAARRAGVTLAHNQYKLVLGNDYDYATCDIRVKWFEQVPVFLLADATDIKPIKYLHDINYTHRVRKKY
jgi:hypothetical protein